MPLSVSMTKSARARFSASGSLPGQDALESCLGHARPRQHPRALHRRGRRHHQHAVEPALGAGLEEERDVEDHDVGAGMRGREGLAVGRDQRMDARLDPGEELGVAR